MFSMDDAEPSGNGVEQDSEGTSNEDDSDHNSDGSSPKGNPHETVVPDESRNYDLPPEPEDRGRSMTPAEKQMSILTLLIFLATAANVWVFYLESEDSSRKLETLSNKAGEIVGTMNTALSNNQDAVQKAFKANRDAVDASEKQSRKALNASIENARSEQRAWVTVKSCALTREPLVGEGFTVDCRVENTGRTPAVSLTNAIITATFPIPLPTPDWNQMHPSAPFLLFPGDSGRGVIAAFRVQNQEPLRTQQLQSIEAYRQSINRIWVLIHLAYRDVFGRSHHTDTCMYRTFGSALNDFLACDSGNEVDTEQADQR
jgi:hypothetical protein